MSGLMRYGLLFTAVLLSGGAAAQFANDELTLVNGEILRGDLVDIDDGVVLFRTKHGSRTYLPIDQIKRGSVHGKRTIKLKDGSTPSGTVVLRDGEVDVLVDDTISTFNLDDVVAIDVVSGMEGEGRTESTITARVESGILFREGNRSRADLYARIELDRTKDWYAWNWYAMAALDGGDDFLGYLRSEFEWLRGPSDGMTPFALLGVERDRDAALDSRAYAAGGLEHRWLNRFGGDFRGGVGVGISHEDFDSGAYTENDALEELSWRLNERRLTGSLSKSDTDLDLYIRIIYEAQLRDRLAFRDELRVMPSLTDLGDVRASYDSNLAWTLLDGLEMNLQLRIDYDDDPPFAELESWRAAIGAGVRVRFGVR